MAWWTRSTRTWCTGSLQTVGARICGLDLMNRKGIRHSNVHSPSMNERPGWGNSAISVEQRGVGGEQRHGGARPGERWQREVGDELGGGRKGFMGRNGGLGRRGNETKKKD
jgi:hypothetical protein